MARGAGEPDGLEMAEERGDGRCVRSERPPDGATDADDLAA